jgi:hypothetical protein
VAAPFHRFVILAGMRTGSNFLEATLNALDGITSHGELFNPHFIGRKDVGALWGMTLADRDAAPERLLSAMTGQGPGLHGFRYFHDHDPRIFDQVMADPRCAKIVLTRAPLESYVSWKLAQATGQWKMSDVRRQKTARVRFDAAEYRAHADTQAQFLSRIRRDLQARGQAAFPLDYGDLSTLEVMNGLASWLGVNARLEAIPNDLKKQNPEPLTTYLDNPDTARAALATLDASDPDHARTLEPRRPAAVPAIHASASGLLFLPLRCGPESAILDVLHRLDGRAPETGLTQRGLRDWRAGRLAAEKPVRSFAVLRHPLFRAYAAFREGVLDAGAPALRTQFARAAGRTLPEPGAAFSDAATEGAAFLAFLHFVRATLNGQTAARVTPHIATQFALLQGFSQVLIPDAVLREETLEPGLRALAATVGLDPERVALPQDDRDLAARLRAIAGPAHENAALAAYARDVQAFGFGPRQG